MATIKYVELSLGADGQRLADLNGIKQDLQTALQYARRYVERYTTDPDSYPIFTHFIVKYARCFNSGVRVRTSNELLDSMSQEDRDVHDIIYALRDKHVGHSVSDWESHRIRLWLTPEERGPRDFTVSTTSDHVLSPGPAIISALIDLIERMLINVDRLTTEEATRLKDLIKKRHSMDEIYAMDATLPSPVTFKTLLAGKGRKPRTERSHGKRP